MAREGMARELLCSDIDGFSLHAAVRVEAYERKRLEQLCRTITRPALADERVQLNDAVQVELKLKTPWRDGTTHLVMSPLEFLQRRSRYRPSWARTHQLGMAAQARGGAALRCLSRLRCRTPVATGCGYPAAAGGAACCVGKPWPTSGSTLRPGPNPARRKRSKTFQLASPEPADARTAR